MKLLLVDDDAFLRDMYAKKFTDLGHEIITAEDPETGLSRIEDHNDLDVVLFDMIMPKMDGVAFLTAARTLPQAKGVSFVVLSNQSETEDQERAKAAGVDGYIVKAESVPSEVVTRVVTLVEDKS